MTELQRVQSKKIKENLIKDCKWQIKYHVDKLAHYELKLRILEESFHGDLLHDAKQGDSPIATILQTPFDRPIERIVDKKSLERPKTTSSFGTEKTSRP